MHHLALAIAQHSLRKCIILIILLDWRYIFCTHSHFPATQPSRHVNQKESWREMHSLAPRLSTEPWAANGVSGENYHFATAKWDEVPWVNIDLIYYFLFKCVILPNGQLYCLLLLLEVHINSQARLDIAFRMALWSGGEAILSVEDWLHLCMCVYKCVCVRTSITVWGVGIHNIFNAASELFKKPDRLRWGSQS